MMRELGADRLAANEDFRRQQAERMMNKREEQERYRQVLQSQVASAEQEKEKQETRVNRSRMTLNEKKVNYDDLQVVCCDARSTGTTVWTSTRTQYLASHRL